MSVKQQIVKQLQNFAAAGGGPFQLDETVPGGQVTASILAVDRFGCEFESLQLQSPNLASKTIDELKHISNALCSKVCYLLEPIALIETDVDTCTTQLRSSPPTKEDDHTIYYEILVRRGGTIALRRYRKQPGDVREAVPSTLTHEVLGRLAEDLSAAASS